jgi:hypothetical protein
MPSSIEDGGTLKVKDMRIFKLHNDYTFPKSTSVNNIFTRKTSTNIQINGGQDSLHHEVTFSHSQHKKS